jgi:hypothetical protein
MVNRVLGKGNAAVIVIEERNWRILGQFKLQVIKKKKKPSYRLCRIS